MLPNMFKRLRWRWRLTGSMVEFDKTLLAGLGFLGKPFFFKFVRFFCIFVMIFLIFIFYGWVWQDNIGGLGFSGKVLFYICQRFFVYLSWFFYICLLWLSLARQYWRVGVFWESPSWKIDHHWFYCSPVQPTTTRWAAARKCAEKYIQNVFTQQRFFSP